MVSREWYRGQDIQSITCKINKPKMRRKPVKCMDTIRVVQFLHNDYILRKMSIKPFSFCANKPSLYSCNIVGILIKVIFFGGGVFLNNHNNVVFTWISCTRNMTIIRSWTWSWNFCKWACYTFLWACNATFSYLIAWIWLSHPLMVCRCYSCISSMACRCCSWIFPRGVHATDLPPLGLEESPNSYILF